MCLTNYLLKLTSGPDIYLLLKHSKKTKTMSNTKNEVIELFTGYSRMSESSNSKVPIMEANCTCVAIKSSTGINIIVDTMDCWSTQPLIDRLKDFQLTPDDFQWCISTHSHVDHLGNNNLFLKTKHIVGQTISHKNLYFLGDEFETTGVYEITPDIQVFATRGHTLSCVSVIIHNAIIHGDAESAPGTVGICGDLFENVEDIDKPLIWIGAGSEDQKAQKENRFKMASMASIIFPGHGKYFKVTEKIREKLQKQIEN